MNVKDADKEWSVPSAALVPTCATNANATAAPCKVTAMAMPIRNDDDDSPHYVDHTYRDFSTYIERGGKVEKHKKSGRNFPARLHAILADEQYSHIISWMPHGRAWKVKDKKLLIEEVVPEFFGLSKYASFARQLGCWGFKRLLKAGPDFGCYYHECFLRGHPQLTILMRRVSPGKGKVIPDIYAEPDFYSMPILELENSVDVDVPNKNESSEDTDEDILSAVKEQEPSVVPHVCYMEGNSTHLYDPLFRADPFQATDPSLPLPALTSSLFEGSLNQHNDATHGYYDYYDPQLHPYYQGDAAVYRCDDFSCYDYWFRYPPYHYYDYDYSLAPRPVHGDVW